MPTATVENNTSLVRLQDLGIDETTDRHLPDREPKKRDIYHKYITLFCDHCGYKYIIQLNCGDRSCPLCRLKWYGYHFKALETILKNWGEDLRVMELTIKNIPDNDFTKASVKMIRKYFNRLLHRKYYKARIKGGFYFIHVTNIGNGFHLHLHIIYKGQYIPHDKLKATWLDVTKGSYIVWIRRSASVRKALKYLLGDLLQKPKVQERYKDQYNSVMKGSRLVQGFGEYSKVKIKRLFICPECGNDSWYCPDFEPELEYGYFDSS